MYYSGGNGAFFLGRFIGLGLSAIGIIACVLILIDVTRRPDWVFSATGQQKGLWIGLPIGGLVLSCCCFIFGVGLGVAYLAAIRPKLEQAQAAGPQAGPPGPPGPPPGGGWGPPPVPPPPPPPSGGGPDQWPPPPM